MTSPETQNWKAFKRFAWAVGGPLIACCSALGLGVGLMLLVARGLVALVRRYPDQMARGALTALAGISVLLTALVMREAYRGLRSVWRDCVEADR